MSDIKNRWETMEDSQKTVMKKLRDTAEVREFLAHRTDAGKVWDSKYHVERDLSKKTGTPTSMLGRIGKELDSFYRVATTPEDRRYVVSKRNEINAEIAKRASEPDDSAS
jgi:hypothetical protein